MIAVDTNLLVYAHRQDAEWHADALAALTELAEGGRRWGIPWACVHEFIAIVTHPRIFNPPTPLDTAFAAVEAWLATPNCTTLGEGGDYLAVLKALSLHARLSGPMIHDARVAAVCAVNGVTELWTADRDFSRFPNLRARNPLVR